MRQENKKSRKAAGAFLCAAVIIGLLSVFLAVMIFPILTVGVGETAAVGIIIFYGIIIIAVIIGIIAALISRLREINGGEEEEAKKY